jgi:hypothetical protein
MRIRTPEAHVFCATDIYSTRVQPVCVYRYQSSVAKGLEACLYCKFRAGRRFYLKSWLGFFLSHYVVSQLTLSSTMDNMFLIDLKIVFFCGQILYKTFNEFSFQGHKVILSASSPYFRKILKVKLFIKHCWGSMVLGLPDPDPSLFS